MTPGVRIGPNVKVLEEPLRSIAEFDTWKFSVMYLLRSDPDFRPFLDENFCFGPKSVDYPVRDLVADVDKDGKPVVNGKSPEEKCFIIDFMLDTIAQYCPKIPNNDLVRDCGSLAQVWQVIRLHSNIETSGTLLNDIWNITRRANETPQALYSRVKQAYDDNLMRKDGIIYKDKSVEKDEELSPTLHCTLILHWLQILHPKLRDLVTQRFCTELRNASYAAIWPEISRSVERLMKELSSDESSICRMGDGFNSRFDTATRFKYGNPARSFPQRSRGSYSRPRGMSSTRSSQQSRHCDYCRMLNRRAYDTHSIEDCLFLRKEKPQSTQGASRSVDVDEYDAHCEEFYEEYPATHEFNPMIIEHCINKVSIDASPVITLYLNNQPYDITLDSGGTCNAIDKGTASEWNCTLRPTLQRAKLGDGKTMLPVIAETDIDLMRHGQSYRLSALVCDMDEPTILAGMPFMIINDISIRPARSEVTLHGDNPEVIKYNPSKPPIQHLRRLKSYTVRSPTTTVILPGEDATFSVPKHVSPEESVLVEPRSDNSHSIASGSEWPAPQISCIKDGFLFLKNDTNDPISLKKNAHICNIIPSIPEAEMPTIPISTPRVHNPKPKKSVLYSTPVQLNPDGIMTEEMDKKFGCLLEDYDEVFNPDISRYNGKSGEVFVEVNMGPEPPPQHKGRVPFYGRENLVELQEKFDDLVSKGVFCRPQDIGVTVEVINTSFLVKKKLDLFEKKSTTPIYDTRATKDKFRLVSDFSAIARFCRPSPTKMPDADSTLRQIGRWKKAIKMDFRESYFQLLVRRSSMKYLGVVSPMKGVYVYTSACMGLPGSEVALEELTCRLFGHLVMQGKLAKLADDIFLGADTTEELYDILEEVLGILAANNLKISAKKTIICPKSMMVLGWIWCDGFLKASPHRLSGLSECEPPTTIKALKSYVGAYRFLSRVIKNYAKLLQPLEVMLSGKQAPNARITWSSEQLCAFQKVQSALKEAKTIVIPKPDDTLQIVTDAAVQPTAIGAVMYAIRDGKTMLAGFYNAKLPVFQRRWLPCELEGVAIGAALNHFAPYIIQSSKKPIILTDSKACCQAVEKMNRGEFSASARLGHFLSAVSRFQATVRHIQGSTNMTSDFISRNPVPCNEPKCQVCSFLKESMTSVVMNAITVSDILEGKVQLPFVGKRAWVEMQETCPDLRNVFKFIRNGTTPGKKGRNFREVKRYITSKVVISSEGALVIRQIEPFNPTSERIVVPQRMIHGVLTVLHIKLSHPSIHQLTKVFNRFFFALNLDKAVGQCTRSCHHCVSLKEVPKALREESTDPPPSLFAQSFAADVIKRNKQLIMVLRECISSYTLAELIENETAHVIADSLLRLSNTMRPSKIIPMKIRVDPHSSHKSLFNQVQNESGLAAHNIKIEIGRELNINHNPVAEKSIRELIKEILNLTPEGGPITSTILSDAVAMLNSRLRAPGLSSHEIFTQRDQTSGLQLDLDDLKLITEQFSRRSKNHKYSEISKAGGRPPHPVAHIAVGDIVYLYDDKSKLVARPRYIVLSVTEGWCTIRRFGDKRQRSNTYKAKLSECYSVSDECVISEDSLPPLPTEECTHTTIQSDTVLHTDDHPVPVATHPVIQEEVLIPPEVHEVAVSEEEEERVIPEEDGATSEGDEVDHSYQGAYPCNSCHLEVKDDDEALLCDSCDEWCHIRCGGVAEEEYADMIKEDEDLGWWSCPNCMNIRQLLEEPPDRK